ncbi:TonB-dependent receptor [Azohydromonas caseinilytica]|uniref:TonB-dependent siderophore receptor n=1 Tax=Azohydromonas caseinilytica TaxID=2728836 RepID=A0A848FBP2_9BURK|nr:TonB-dependent siderophore receptor [Azohydromonas caseinilytica]NML16326.1 TonB-dependent siderophore receptor [Azohydromonas caseinilytica]
MNNKYDRRALLPLGALAAGFSIAGGAMAQAEAPAQPQSQAEAVLPAVRAKGSVERAGNQSIRTTTTTIGKGQQQLRDIPQSVTVVTEKLIDDRNLDTLKETLKNTAGVTFMAAEGGEEDIRLRGFSLAQAGDIFVDGMREPAFYERDTFNYDRLELLRGSASMLFGRGSTGGAVNQVSKQPRLIDEHEVRVTVGNHEYRRLTGDFNIKTGEESALRLNVMHTKADNNGSGSSIEKAGVAGAFRWGIGTADEFSAGLFYLNNNNGMNYGLPWIKPVGGNPPSGSPNALNTVLPGLSPDAYYGMASDYNDGYAAVGTLSHLHRFDNSTELRTTLRKGRFDRDQRASSIRFAGTSATATNPFTNPAAVGLNNFGPATVLNRGTNLKIQDMDTLQLQSDFSSKFEAVGLRHEVLAGVDISREEKTVYGVSPTSPVLVKGQIRADGTLLGSNWVDESRRQLTPSNAFEAHNWGVYAQDLVQVAPEWKLLGGLRFDHLKGEYDQIVGTAANAAGRYEQTISNWSKRVGVLYQPTPQQSYHFSWGTSFNTSGDTYSYNRLSANTPPEESENIELGAKLDSADNRFTTRLAVFRSTKKNERNTDATSVTDDSYLLSAKRHATGFELDFTGRLTPQWEVYGSYMWIPSAKVDEAASASFGNRKGDRPGLTPKHSGTIWTTYQFTPKLRLGAGVNFRSKQSPADVTIPQGADPATARWDAPGWATFDLMGEYTFSDKVSLKVNVNNVADKYYADSLYRGHYIPGFGRIVQAQLVSKF